ncbi:MAG: phosphoribosylanthranilate isomerase [Leptolyngbyaceae cyanobacterium SM1_3_5]|nr:phosphoribosylanthranilate isomerase [Leptolyngbyaceae cyanobacterium SM1_3_5]
MSGVKTIRIIRSKLVSFAFCFEELTVLDQIATNLRIKICGVTRLDQAEAIAQMGATAIGFICVPDSPRYVSPAQIRSIIEQLETPIDRVGVFANESIDSIVSIVEKTDLNVVQLHGNETPEFCEKLRSHLAKIELIKAFRIRSADQLAEVLLYQDCVDTFLLDAYSPHALGGTGHTIDWKILQNVGFDRPWFLAGGITPDNVLAALILKPNGIDLSSGVEIAPGNKDLTKVKQLFDQLNYSG